MIGCGAFARQFHGPAQQLCAKRDPGLELVACCDREPGRAEAYAREFGYRRHFGDVEAMFAAETLDAVVLAVPPNATGAAAGAILKMGYPLLLEKPPGTTANELARLIEAARVGRGPAQVAFNRRHMPAMKRAREILDTAFPPASITSLDYAMIRHERWDADFSTTAVHAIDAVRFLAGAPFRAAVVTRVGGQRRGEVEAMNLDLAIECVGGLRARIAIRPVAGLNAETAVIHGLGQTLKMEIPFPGQPCTEGRVEHWRACKRIETFSDEGLAAVEKMGIYEETRAFLVAVRSGVRPQPTLEDCIQQVALMEALRLGRTGQIDFCE